MNRELLLGVNGGGSTTAAWLADRNGAILGRGREARPTSSPPASPPRSNHSSANPLGVSRRRRRAKRVSSACLGLAGADRQEDKEFINSWGCRFGLADRLVLVNDGELVIAAGTPEGVGVGVIAGTGSIAVGRDRAGRIALRRLGSSLRR